MRRLVARLAAILAALLVGVPSATAAELNLWEWMNVAPIVALVEVGGGEGRETVAVVARVFRGEIGVGSAIALDVRAANRSRPGGVRALDLREGTSYLALLEPAPKRRDPEERPLYRFVRGVEGVREIPAEGAAAWIEAADRIARIRGLDNDILRWETLAALLADPNPILMRTALDAHLDFARGDSALFPSLLPLLDHPSPEVRAGAASVSGSAIRREPGSCEGGPGRETVLRLIALARRDPDPAVRVAATRSLAEVRDEASRRVLREVAAEDPEQRVRFEAERILFEDARREPRERD